MKAEKKRKATEKGDKWVREMASLNLKNKTISMGALMKFQKITGRMKRLSKAIMTTTDSKKKKKLEIRYYGCIADRAELYIEQNEFKAAEKLYRKLPSKVCGEQRYYGISKILIETERYGEAKSLLAEALEKYPESSTLLNSMGLLFYRMDDLYEALRYFDHALAIEANDNTAMLYNRALSLNLLGYYEEAYKILANLLEIFPDDTQYLVEMGYCNLERKEPWAAINYYRTAKELGLESDNVYGGLCCSYIDAGLRHEAYMIAKEGVEKIPDDARLYENLAQTAIDLGRHDEADEVIQKGLALEPGNEPLKELQQTVKQRMAEKHSARIISGKHKKS